jgi:hypothetical protein
VEGYNITQLQASPLSTKFPLHILYGMKGDEGHLYSLRKKKRKENAAEHKQLKRSWIHRDNLPIISPSAPFSTLAA